MIAGPLLLLILPLAMAGIVYILLRWESLSALLAVGTALAMGIAIVTLPMDQPVRPFPFLGGEYQIALGETVTFFGRELVLEQADRMAMAHLFFTAAGIFLLAWRTSPHSLLFPMGLGLLSLLGTALLIRPLIYAALLVGIAAALAVFALQAEEGSPTRGGMRYLTFTILALPGLLVTHWLLDRYALTPDDTGLLSASAALLSLSFALLLGVVPFHTWVPAITSDSVPLAGVFVLTVGNDAVWFLLLDFLETYPWISARPGFSSLVLTAGTGLVIVGGLLASSQRRLGPLVGYAALVDTGAALVALGMNSRLGLTLVILSLFVRPFGLLLVAAGLSGLRARSGGNDSFDALRGVGWKAPWSMAALVFGGLSVAGLPVSAGFIWRWPLYRALMSSNSGSTLLLFLAGVGVMIGIWRVIPVLLERPRSPENRSVVPYGNPEGWLTAAVVVVVILACVGVGLFPQVLAPWAGRLAETYTFLSP
ncbi:MAG: proton-conducting transporter membrane subunit [Chloroflexota bacterium]|nr:proton-conducting transporter membrane subunit [Chloroflexota bacterium]